VRESDQQAAIDHINQQKAPDRYRVFTTPVDVATPQARLKVIAILYHYEQVWYAAWLPPKQDKSQYVYGHAYAFKNTAAAAKVAPSWIWNSKDKCIEHTIGRGVQTFTFSETITEEEIKASFDSGYKIQQWQASNLYCQKGYQIRDHAVIPFEKSLKEDIPTWDDCRGIFDRLRCKNIFDAAEIPGGMSKYLDNNDGLTVDNLISAANKFNQMEIHQALIAPWLVLNVLFPSLQSSVCFSKNLIVLSTHTLIHLIPSVLLSSKALVPLFKSLTLLTGFVAYGLTALSITTKPITKNCATSN